MKVSFLKKLVCPFDKEELDVKILQQENDEIQQGVMTCRKCQRYYPIVQGIAVMSPDEYRQFSLEKPLLEKWGEATLAEKFIQ